MPWCADVRLLHVACFDDSLLLRYLYYYLGLQIMTASPLSASRLSAAISELEQALSALDQTVNAVMQSLPETAAHDLQNPSAANREIKPVGEVRKELAALQELVSGAAELIALARSGNSADAAHQ